jgi:hypothetical protein
MTWIAYFICLISILFVIYKHDFFRLPGLHRLSSVFFFLLKIIAGLGIWAVYTFYYPDREYADIWKYFDDSSVMYNAIHDHPEDYFKMISGIGIDERIDDQYFHQMNHWHQKFENNLFNDSHTIIRFNAIVRIFSGGNYHTHSLIMCLLAFIGLCALYRWIYPVLFQWKKVVAFLLFVSPSLLFWSSGVLKEGILLFALGMLIYHSWKYMEDRRGRRFVWIALAVFLLAMTKLYILAFVIPALIIGIVLRFFPNYARLKIVIAFIALIGCSIALHITIPSFSPYRVIASKQNDFLNLARGGTYLVSTQHVTYLRPDQHQLLIPTKDSGVFTIANGSEYYCWNIYDNFADTIFIHNSQDTARYTILTDNPSAGSLLAVESLKPTPISLLKSTPSALLNTILRPYLWEFKPLIMLPALLENILTAFLVLCMIIWHKKSSAKSALWFCITLALLTLVVVGLTTPVLGAIVRYRITALPFLLFAVLISTDRQKVMKALPFLERIL